MNIIKSSPFLKENMPLVCIISTGMLKSCCLASFNADINLIAISLFSCWNNMLQQIWQNALLGSIRYVGKKILWKTKIIDTVSAFSALELEKNFKRLNHIILFMKKASLAEDYSLMPLPENIKRKQGCYRRNMFFVNYFVNALVQSRLLRKACPAPEPVAYARFSKGVGAGNSENLRITKTRMKLFPTRISQFQNQVKTKKKKRSLLKFSPVFGPKLGADQ